MVRKYLALVIVLVGLIASTFATAQPVAANNTPNNLKTSRRGNLTLYTLDVPYLNQLYDTDATFDGNCACGPTSLAMVLAYYGRIQPKARVLKTPFLHTDYYGWAITDKGYSYGQTAFNRSVLDCAWDAGDRYGGLYGALMVNDANTLTEWARMTNAIKAHGLGVNEPSPISFNIVRKALLQGHPVILTTRGLTGGGHLVVVVGYTSDDRLIVNDPYGFKGDGYPNYNGARVLYTWADLGGIGHAWEVLPR